MRAALAVCALVLAAVAAGSARAAVPVPPPDVRTTLTPEILLFGDTLNARVDVLVNKKRMDPDSVKVEMDFYALGARRAGGAGREGRRRRRRSSGRRSRSAA